MDYGFENNLFYVEHPTCRRQPQSFKKECELRAVEIYQSNPKQMLSLSSGLDSQIALHSFLSQGIPLECAFMYLENVNEVEYEQVKILEKKLNFKSHIIKLNHPTTYREELEHLAKLTDTNVWHAMYIKFLEQLPGEYDFINTAHDPWIVTDWKSMIDRFIYCYYDPTVSRLRALDYVTRQGKNIEFVDTSEALLSIIEDDILKNFLDSKLYFRNQFKQNQIYDVYRWDYYIKPFLYSKHWGNELEYFPKLAGHENIKWITDTVNSFNFKNICYIEKQELIDHLRNFNAPSKKFFEKK